MALAAAALAVHPGSAAAWTQGVSTAGLRGLVVDRDGGPVEGALVTLEHAGTGATSTSVTAADGRYTLRSLRPGGPYTLTVTRIGFAEHAREDIELLLGRFVNLDVALLPEAVAIEGIEVEVRRDIEFDPGRIGISTLVTSDIIEELPTLTRDFVDLAALSPLSRVSQQGVSVAGASFRFNTLNVDGALNQDLFGLSTQNIAGGRAGGRAIPLDAVEQFQVLVAPFDVRQSGFTGGALNAVTRSGTNAFETSAFGFFRSAAHVGSLVIDDVATTPELSTAHGGFTIGGPIRRDRAHFFVAGEWETVREPPTGFHVGESDPLRLALVADTVARLTSLLEGYGADPGAASSLTLENTIFNLFARFDWEMGERHDAMLRYSFASADDDPDPNRLPGDHYELSSSGSVIRSRSHSAVFQLFSTFPGGLSNEFAFNVQHLDDSETARSATPQVEVRLDGLVDDFRVRRDVRSGAGYYFPGQRPQTARRSGVEQLQPRRRAPFAPLRRIEHLVRLRPPVRSRRPRQLPVREPGGPRAEPAGPLRDHPAADRGRGRTPLRRGRTVGLHAGRMGRRRSLHRSRRPARGPACVHRSARAQRGARPPSWGSTRPGSRDRPSPHRCAAASTGARSAPPSCARARASSLAARPSRGSRTPFKTTESPFRPWFAEETARPASTPGPPPQRNASEVRSRPTMRRS